MEAEAGKISNMRQTQPTIETLKMEERSHKPKNMGNIQKPGTALTLWTAREWGPQPYKHKELNSAYNQNEQENRFPQEPPGRNASLLTLSLPQGGSFRISDLRTMR